jgi:hypothetical protein
VRPRPEVPWEVPDRLLAALALLVLAGFLAPWVAGWGPLPERVPMHYGADGRVDRWGGAASIHLLAFVALVDTVGLLLLARVPHVYNYPFAITEANAAMQYRLARRLLLVVAILTNAMFLYIDLMTWRVALGFEEGLSPWFLFVVLTAIFVSLGWYFNAAWRGR